MTQPRGRRRWLILAIPVAAIVLVAALWDWNWFRPIVESRASAALGRHVTVGHLSVHPGWTSTIVADGIRIGNPDGFPADPPFTTANRLSITINIGELLHGRIVLPAITVEKPVVEAAQTADGTANWSFPALSGGGGQAKPSNPPQIGALIVQDGHAHVVSAKLRTDMAIDVATEDTAANGNQSARVVARARGTYAGQPITADATAGTILSLRDAGTPYPINMHIANGPTKVALDGTVENPLSFAGANLKLQLSGPDMSLAAPLTGIAIPKTPPFQTAGNLDYRAGHIHYDHFTGRVGSSDIAGDIDLDPGAARPVITADLQSRQIDLADLAGFIGGEPGRANTPNQTAEQRRAIAAADASPKLLPDKPISVPDLKSADVHVKFRAGHLKGQAMPLDNLVANVDIVDGHVTLKPASFAVEKGAIETTLDLVPGVGNKAATVKVHTDFKRVDLGHLLAATKIVRGAGTITGQGSIDGTGNSVADIVANGNGALTLSMVGGDLSSLVVDLSGFQFGKALLSALGMPDRSKLNCMIADFDLNRGVLNSRTLVIDFENAIINGAGNVNLARETVDITIKSDSKHFSVGTLPAPIHVTGTFKSPSIRPELAEAGTRAAAAAALAVVFPPAAILPTITLGVGENDACARLTQGARASSK